MVRKATRRDVVRSPNKISSIKKIANTSFQSKPEEIDDGEDSWTPLGLRKQGSQGLVPLADSNVEPSQSSKQKSKEPSLQQQKNTSERLGNKRTPASLQPTSPAPAQEKNENNNPNTMQAATEIIEVESSENSEDRLDRERKNNKG